MKVRIEFAVIFKTSHLRMTQVSVTEIIHFQKRVKVRIEFANVLKTSNLLMIKVRVT